MSARAAPLGLLKGALRQLPAVIGVALLIGAVYVDGGFEPARDLILRAWGERLTPDAAPARDAKTAVQEWAQARALAAPRYEEVSRSGPAHAPHFVMRVMLAGYEPEVGEASSKRSAEQAAAQAFLDRWSGN